MKTEETAKAIAKGAAANPTYVVAVLTMKPLAALVLVIGLRNIVWGCCPLDSSKVTALLVNPSAWLWWGTGQVLVKVW